MNLELSTWEWVWVALITGGLWVIVPLLSGRGGKRDDGDGSE